MTDVQLEALNALADKLAETILKPTPVAAVTGGSDLCMDCCHYGLLSPWATCRAKMPWHRACLSYNTKGVVDYEMPFGYETDACPF